MEINQKFEFVEGTFNTNSGQLICVRKDKYASVELCFKENMHIPFAKIKLFSSDLYVDAQETMNDAYNLGNEICDRWNKHTNAIDKINEWITEAEKQAGYAKRDGANFTACSSEAMAFAYKSCLELLTANSQSLTPNPHG